MFGIIRTGVFSIDEKGEMKKYYLKEANSKIRKRRILNFNENSKHVVGINVDYFIIDDDGEIYTTDILLIKKINKEKYTETPYQLYKLNLWIKIDKIVATDIYIASVSVDGELWVYGFNKNGNLGLDNFKVNKLTKINMNNRITGIEGGCWYITVVDEMENIFMSGSFSSKGYFEKYNFEEQISCSYLLAAILDVKGNIWIHSIYESGKKFTKIKSDNDISNISLCFSDEFLSHVCDKSYLVAINKNGEILATNIKNNSIYDFSDPLFSEFKGIAKKAEARFNYLTVLDIDNNLYIKKLFSYGNHDFQFIEHILNNEKIGPKNANFI